jgi:hypothetical protein
MSELFAETRSETRARMAADMQLADDFTAHRASTEQRCAGVCTHLNPDCLWLASDGPSCLQRLASEGSGASEG